MGTLRRSRAPLVVGRVDVAREAIRRERVTIFVRHELGRARSDLMRSLGVTVVVDPGAPPCVGPCGGCVRPRWRIDGA